MATHDFLFSYTVSPKNPAYKNDADDIRRKIANIKSPSWVKYTDVETVFSGEFDLTGLNSAKRAQAEEKVKNTINQILVENKCVSKVKVIVVLMVDQLGKPMHFTI
ncbi:MULTISPECIES: hypothetical protein [Acinetobacter]|nr:MULTISPECIES: hypothetical protein [Acinetobacter]ELW89912.1 hypothetical protein ACINWC743_A0358 [Acinetobacter sp. WC-743]MBJ8427627.1 hypothetical protein [Acinetobacter bereziniae]MBJ8477602.1 hypothetical protein [Acinetobacter bereziniae]